MFWPLCPKKLVLKPEYILERTQRFEFVHPDGPETWQLVNEMPSAQNNLRGIGCHLDRWESGEIAVSSLKPGGSAEEGGLMVGSVLHSVDGITGKTTM